MIKYYLISYTGLSFTEEHDFPIDKNFDAALYVYDSIFLNREATITYLVEQTKETLNITLDESHVAITNIKELTANEYQAWKGYTDEEMKTINNQNQ